MVQGLVKRLPLLLLLGYQELYFCIWSFCSRVFAGFKCHNSLEGQPIYLFLPLIWQKETTVYTQMFGWFLYPWVPCHLHNPTQILYYSTRHNILALLLSLQSSHAAVPLATFLRILATFLTFWLCTFLQILAHSVFKMWVIQKPNKVALWNKRHFEEKKLEIIQHV